MFGHLSKLFRVCQTREEMTKKNEWKELHTKKERTVTETRALEKREALFGPPGQTLPAGSGRVWKASTRSRGKWKEHGEESVKMKK